MKTNVFKMVRKFIYTYLLVSLYNSLTTDGGSNYDILKLGKKHCANNEFCTLNKTSFNDESCCAECDCGEPCLRTKSCCPDAFDRWDDINYTSVDLVCEDGYYLNDYYLNRQYFGKPDIFYNMKTHCSNGRPCETPDRNSTESFDDIVAVFDNTTDTLYRNKRCAECNGVYNYFRWILFVIRCDKEKILEYLQHKNFDETLSYMLHSCIMVSVPPDLDTRPYTCHRDSYISTCNTTKQWDVFDDELQTACLNPFTIAPYYVPYSTRQYKNVFCYLCNSPVNVSVHDSSQCALELKGVMTDFSNLPSVDFSAKIPNKPPGDVIVTACKTYQMFDVFHNVCRTVNCYDSRIPSYEQCITGPVRYEIRTRIDVQFGFYPIPNRIDTNGTLTFIKNVHILEFLESKLNITHCLNCLGPQFPKKIQVYLDKTKNHLKYFVAELRILKSPDCSYEYIFAAVHSLIEEKITIPVFVNNESFDFIIERSQSHKYNESPPIGIFLPTQCSTVEEISQYNGFREPLSPLICPYVILNEIEFCKLVYIYMQTHNIQSVDNTTCPMIFGAVTFPKYYVCVDTFQQVRALRTYQSGNQSSKGIVSLITTCVSMFCILISVGIYLYLNKFRSAPMYVLFSALGNLFIAQGVFQFGSGWSEYKRICEVMGIAVHYFWLSSMFAMSSYCVIVMRNIQTLRSSDTARKTIFVAFACIYGLPLCFVIHNMIYATFTQAQNEFRSGYGASSCHIDNNLMRGLLFSLPIFLTVIVNCFVYAVTVYRIRNIASAVARNRKSVHYGIVYFRLLLASGVTWLIGFVNQFLNASMLDYLFIVCAAGQGIFLLISILLSGAIRRDIRIAIASICTKSDTCSSTSLT